jgi:integrase/recombinase XerD
MDLQPEPNQHNKLRDDIARNTTGSDLWEQFLQDRVYNKGVSEETVRYYRWVRGAFLAILAAPTRAGMIECKAALLAKGVTPISINTYLRGFKAYVRWMHAEGHLPELFRVEFLRCETKILATLTRDQVREIITYRPRGVNDRRAHAIALVLLDTGIRIGECLRLRRTDMDFDNMLLRVRGKGARERLVPFSAECRKVLFRIAGRKQPDDLVFPTRTGTEVSRTNFVRDFRALGKHIGITGVRMSPHTMRHSFAVNFLTSGGDIYILSRILGHTSVKTTEVYLRSLGVEALQAAQARTTLLRGTGR